MSIRMKEENFLHIQLSISEKVASWGREPFLRVFICVGMWVCVGCLQKYTEPCDFICDGSCILKCVKNMSL